MTVCVAAICEDHTLVAASDRMLTAGDIQFEPQQSKIINLTSSIAALAAGDSAMQAEIFQLVKAEVNQRIAENPTEWLYVRDVAEMYSHYCNAVRLKRAEIAILAPLGLTVETFTTQQQQLSPALANQIATELKYYATPVVQVIFVGVDYDGTHIYVAENANVSCHDHIGFAAIGAGYWHADSQFMFAGHMKARPLPETLLLTFSAKKRAEVAPGVGESTDMLMVGPSLGSYVPIGEHVLQKLEEIYETTQNAIREAVDNAEESVNAFVEEITAAVTPKRQSSAPEEGGGVVPADQTHDESDSAEA